MESVAVVPPAQSDELRARSPAQRHAALDGGAAEAGQGREASATGSARATSASVGGGAG